MSAAENRIDFSREDEEKMASTATWGLIIAFCSILTAAVGLSTVFEHGLEDALLTAVAVGVEAVLGVMLYLASVAFRRVARTDDDDHRYLMRGLGHLRIYFAIQGILVILLLAAACYMAYTMLMAEALF